MKYKAEGVPLVVLAGTEYGTGSSRDWAAKGTFLLGVRAVIAASFERIHRSNLVGMGVLPLEFLPGQTWQSLGLTGEEIFDILGLDDTLQPRQHADGRRHARRRHARRVRSHRPHRHAGRARLLPQRRHPADGAAQAAALQQPDLTNEAVSREAAQRAKARNGLSCVSRRIVASSTPAARSFGRKSSLR